MSGKDEDWRERIPLHGQLERDIKRLKAVRSFDWVARGDLKRETEALIVATKDQALNALSIEKEAYETDLR